MAVEYTQFHQDFLTRLRDIDPAAASLAEEAFHLVVKRLPPSLNTDQTQDTSKKSAEDVDRPSKKLELELAHRLYDVSGRFINDELPLVYLLPLGKERSQDRLEELLTKSFNDYARVKNWITCIDSALNERQRLSLYRSMRTLVGMGVFFRAGRFGMTGVETYPNVGTVRSVSPQAIVNDSHSYAERYADRVKNPYYNFPTFHIGIKAAEFIYTSLHG